MQSPADAPASNGPRAAGHHDTDEHGFGVASVIFTLTAVILAFVAIGVAAAALSTSNDAKDAAAAAGGTKVALTEFAITPSPIVVGEGGVITVQNNGSVEHNLEVSGQDLVTSNLKPGTSEVLDVSSLAPGDYTVFCNVPGHAGAGMKTTLTVGSGGGHGHMSGSESASLANNEQADTMMAAPTEEYVKQLTDGPNTKGVGNQPLAPTILPDGTLEFRLTASVIDWEVAPGRTVRAWAYNDQVPGPLIQVGIGDRVRVVLDNQLPESTAIHFHGIETPNAMDGVPDVTQPPVKPGEQFVYEFTAKGPAVGMYHSHHHAEHQVPDGLAGAFLIGDEPVPAGVTVAQKVPMVLNDAGVIGLSLNGKSFPATAPVTASLGEWVEIDYFNEGLQVHPMHLHGLPQVVIAKDGFPLTNPQTMDTVLVAPGERYTVLVHATEPGVWAFHCHILTHAEGSNGMFGMVTTMIVK